MHTCSSRSRTWPASPSPTLSPSNNIRRRHAHPPHAPHPPPHLAPDTRLIGRDPPPRMCLLPPLPHPPLVAVAQRGWARAKVSSLRARWVHHHRARRKAPAMFLPSSPFPLLSAPVETQFGSLIPHRGCNPRKKAHCLTPGVAGQRPGQDTEDGQSRAQGTCSGASPLGRAGGSSTT